MPSLTSPNPRVWALRRSLKDGRALLAELGALRHDDVFFRAHNLLTSGDGTPALKWSRTPLGIPPGGSLLREHGSQRQPRQRRGGPQRDPTAGVRVKADQGYQG
jgi:hypothetical protein